MIKDVQKIKMHTKQKTIRIVSKSEPIEANNQINRYKQKLCHKRKNCKKGLGIRKSSWHLNIIEQKFCLKKLD